MQKSSSKPAEFPFNIETLSLTEQNKITQERKLKVNANDKK